MLMLLLLLLINYSKLKTSHFEKLYFVAGNPVIWEQHPENDRESVPSNVSSWKVKHNQTSK